MPPTASTRLMTNSKSGSIRSSRKNGENLRSAAIGLWCCLCWRHRQACSGEARSATAPIKRPTGLAIDFEPLARWGTTTQLTVHLSSPKGGTADQFSAVQARVFVSNEIVEPLGLQQVVPQPNATEAIGGGAVYNFAIPPGRNSAMVRFLLKPSTVGLVTAEVREVDGESLFWTQMVLP